MSRHVPDLSKLIKKILGKRLDLQVRRSLKKNFPRNFQDVYHVYCICKHLENLLGIFQIHISKMGKLSTLFKQELIFPLEKTMKETGEDFM